MKRSELEATLTEPDRQEWAAARLAVSDRGRGDEGFRRASPHHQWFTCLDEGRVSQRWYDFAADWYGDMFHYTGD